MRVAIVGSGYVGLTAAAGLSSLGHAVCCVDVAAERVAAIERGEIPFYEPGLNELVADGLARGTLRATTDLAGAVAQSEITLITVGTPPGNRGIDLSYVQAAARGIGRALREVADYHAVVVKSTVTPGTSDGVVRPLIERESGRTADELGLCVNPEFLREGHAVADFLDPDRIVVGQSDERAGDAVARLYDSFSCPIVRTTPANAEMIKYTSNALLATLISFSNEIAALCEATPGADAQAVLRALHLDQRLSPLVGGERVRPGILSYLWAGCGFGGSCLPKDVNALRAYADDHVVDVPLLDAVMAVNARCPDRLVDLAEQAIGSLEDAQVAVLGLAFKPGTSDLRDSPAFSVIQALRDRGAIVRAYDPIVTAKDSPRSAPDGIVGNDHDARELNRGVMLCPTKEAALRGADAALLVTACPEFAAWDWSAVLPLMRHPVVIDGRGALGDVRWPGWARYLPIGRVVEKEKVGMRARGGLTPGRPLGPSPRPRGEGNHGGRSF